ncbi:MAG: aldehyde dehydrogenase family protein, partial [Myxococcales bacterium]|nr:aldehyde dehydrogenase family protein [Myxococcales bacterium]
MDASVSTLRDTAAWHELAERLRPETRCFVDGEFVPARAGGVFETINPATGQVLAEVARGTAQDIDAAVAAARRAFKSGVWSRMAPRDRMEVLYRTAHLIQGHATEFALLDTLDMGKPISDMLASDVPGAVRTFQFFAETIDKLDGMVTNTAPSALHYILRQPLGVVGCIVPWNYPLLMAAWKLAPALAAGNTVVLKPAEESPLSALLLAKLFLEAGGPAGVLNVVPGFGEEAGKALALHNDVDKIGFTGSVEVGKLMMIYAGQSNMKRVSTECGGKSPQIVLADTPDLDSAVAYAVDGIYANQGEVCNAGSRLLVAREILDEFTEKFRQKAKTAFVPGDP